MAEVALAEGAGPAPCHLNAAETLDFLTLDETSLYHPFGSPTTVRAVHLVASCKLF
jgi:hypothetical protein